MQRNATPRLGQHHEPELTILHHLERNDFNLHHHHPPLKREGVVVQWFCYTCTTLHHLVV
jgi:hypothetical protein